MQQDGEASASIECDVAVVGAGIAGLILADRLRRSNLNVVVLESGDEHQETSEHPLNETEQVGIPYQGAALGRFRCLGGTSTRWGGALIPFLPEDFETSPGQKEPAWQVPFRDIAKYVREAERFFQVDDGGYDELSNSLLYGREGRPLSDGDIGVRFAKWPRFAKRNVAKTLQRKITDDQGLRIWLNATVTGFEIDRQHKKVRRITATTFGTRSLTVAAQHFVLCAGAIECTRLLLMLNRKHDDRIFTDQQGLGRYFHDHISVPLASIQASDTKALNHVAGFRFVHGIMRSPRFEVTKQAQREDRTGSAFAHISAESVGRSGFDELRQFMRSVQQWPPSLGNLFAAGRDLPYLAEAAEWRVIHKRLRWPLLARYDVHFVAEQSLNPDSRIVLSKKNDALGSPMAMINWQVTDTDVRTLRCATARFDAFWLRAGLNDVGQLNWKRACEELSVEDIAPGTDIFHPGGTTRIGLDPGTSVLNTDLATHSLANLYVASTSAFPPGGSASPTLTLAAFALRLGDHIANDRPDRSAA